MYNRTICEEHLNNMLVPKTFPATLSLQMERKNYTKNVQIKNIHIDIKFLAAFIVFSSSHLSNGFQ